MNKARLRTRGKETAAETENNRTKDAMYVLFVLLYLIKARTDSETTIRRMNVQNAVE